MVKRRIAKLAILKDDWFCGRDKGNQLRNRKFNRDEVLLRIRLPFTQIEIQIVESVVDVGRSARDFQAFRRQNKLILRGGFLHVARGRHLKTKFMRRIHWNKGYYSPDFASFVPLHDYGERSLQNDLQNGWIF